jgi:3-oxoacyl-[acyl-carrier-protein] synthase-3
VNFGVLDIQYEVGEIEIDLIEQHPEYAAVLEKTGMPRLYRTEQSVEDLAFAAARKLIDRNRDAHRTVTALIVVSQSSDYHLPSIACEIHRRLELPTDSIAFDINQGCSGFVQALTVAVALLGTHEHVLIVCVDKYRSKLRAGDRSTESVFSDAASATLLHREGGFEITRQSHLTDGSGRRFLVQRIGEDLTMAGADVFLWTRSKVTKQIQTLISEEATLGRNPHSVALHQASKLVVETIRNQLPKDIVVPNDVARYGNTVSSTIPILLANYPNLMNRNGTFILAGFGVGLSSSVVALTRRISDL